MGIPGFFGWLMRKYDNSFYTASRPNQSIDELYIDANCMLHPSCFQILKKASLTLSVDKLEDEMIEQCINDLNFLIQYVKPRQLLYLAVDGVAPLAKISQQRKRRYKSYDETTRKNEIKKKYNQLPQNSWTNASITPGTQFMEKLHIRLSSYLKNVQTTQKVIYSSYHTCGEGEHKIFDYIRKQYDIKTRVIYGLDADLIFLALASQKERMYLIREDTEIRGRSKIIGSNGDAPTDFMYVSIDFLIGCFNEQVHDLINQRMIETSKNKVIPDNMINDVIFICYFLGNDFIPHVPSIDIKKNGMEMLLNAYVTAFMNNKSLMIDISQSDTQLNVLFFNDFLSALAILEKETMSRDHAVAVQRFQRFESPCEEELWKLDNMQVIKSVDIFRKHTGNFDDWKFHYYHTYEGCFESQEQTIKDMCHNYIDGIMWIAQYYFGTCPSWTWVYEYHCAPFVNDLSKFIQTYKYNVNEHVFDMGEPLKPVTQLLCVIHPMYSYLLPKEYAELMKEESSIGDMFPRKFKLDIYNKDMFWQCSPILPPINLSRIIETTKDIKKTYQVSVLNETCNDIIYKK
jgi:5'-3' exonuclease